MQEASTRISTTNFAYLILRVGSHLGYRGKRSGPLAMAMRKASREHGIHTWMSNVQAGMMADNTLRTFFVLNGQSAVDDLAHEIAESIIFATELFYGPLIEAGEDNLTLRLPLAACSTQRRNLKVRDLVEAAVAEQAIPTWRGILTGEIGNCKFIPDEYLAVGWVLSPYVRQNARIHDALSFYSASVRRFYPPPSIVEEACAVGIDLGRPNRSILASAEGAFQDAYKAIEAVIGDPPSADEKLAQRLESAGLHANEEVGLVNKRPLLTAIRELNRTRDQRAAHGSTPRRGLSVLEVLECQKCAQLVLQAALDHITRYKVIEHYFTWQSRHPHRKRQRAGING
jgi:hypothetical protein